jgi:hypothetical protein
MRRKVIAGTAIFVLTFLVVSLVAAAEDLGAKAAKKTAAPTSTSDVGKKVPKPIIKVPPLLRLRPGETEADKLKGMVQFIKENRPYRLGGCKQPVPKWQCAFCRQFMEDLLHMRNIHAIEVLAKFFGNGNRHGPVKRFSGEFGH